MKSMISSLVLVLVAFFLSLTAAAPVDIRDVFVPPVLSPNANSVWEIGTIQTVTWDVSRPPKQITNSRATIILVHNGRLDLDHPLATNLDVLVGHADVEVPNVEPGTNYQIIVFGDSGNTGEAFTITAPESR